MIRYVIACEAFNPERYLDVDGGYTSDITNAQLIKSQTEAKYSCQYDLGEYVLEVEVIIKERLRLY